MAFHDASISKVTTGGKRPFGMRDKIGYMFGDFGNDFTFLLQSMFFMIFYTNVVGINPAHVGTLLLVARVVDGFTDVGMGILVDRLPVKGSGDKFRRWIKFVAIPVAVASALMYMSFISNWESYGMRLTWMVATYFLWGSLCYTAINIPYGSMASVVSHDPNERAQLSVFRSTGAVLAQLAITALLPLIVYTTNEAGVSVLSGPRMTWGAIICSVLAVVCYSMCYLNVEERVVSAPKSKAEGGTSVIGSLGKVFTNRALLGLIAAALILLISMMFLNGMVGYLFLNYFGNGKLQSPASMLALAPSLALIVICPWLSRRFGKAEVGTVSMATAGIILVVTYLLKIGNPIIFIAIFAIVSLLKSIFNFLVWAFITDVIDYQEVRTGQRDDATVYALYSWARKLGQAIAGGATGWALGWIGYDAEAAANGLEQTEAVKDSIYMLTTLVPGVGYMLVGLCLLLLYPLKKKMVEQNNAILQARRAGIEK